MKKDNMYMAGIVEIPVNKINPFPNHPFRLYQGERLDDLVESIKEHGIMNPVIVLRQGTEYEMLSGHNRWNAAMLAGLKKIPAIVKEKLSKEEAYVYVIETNLMQRSFADLTPSEKAAVLKVRYDKEACQGKRNDIIAEIARLEGKEVPETSDIGSKKMHTRDRIGKDYDLSGSSVARLLKLNDLIVPFKDWVDMGVLTEKIGVQLAFLPQSEQKLIFRVVRADKSKITVAAVIKFRSHSGELTEGAVRKYLRTEPKKKGYKVPAKIVEKYFQGMDPNAVDDIVEQALEIWFKNEKNR